MTSFEADNDDIFNAITARMDTVEDVVSKVTAEVQDAQNEFIKALGTYCLKPLPEHYDDVHDALYETVSVLAEAVPDIFASTKEVDERTLVFAGLSDILADARLEGFSTITQGKYTVFDTRTAADKEAYREALTFMLEGRDVFGEEGHSLAEIDEHSMMVGIGRMLRDEIHSDVDEFYRRANIDVIDSSEEIKNPESTS